MTNNERDTRFLNDERSPELRASEPVRTKLRRGFAVMDPTRQREIASKGGRASHAKGTGHEWNAEAAREAGRKGGLASRGGRGRAKAEGVGATASAPEASATPAAHAEDGDRTEHDTGRDMRGEF